MKLPIIFNPIKTPKDPAEKEKELAEKMQMKQLLKNLREHEYSRKNIKDLLFHYYKFYPEDFVEGMSWIKRVLSKQDIRIFLEKGILVRSEDGEMIKLGPAGLNLISMWHTEKLTKLLIIITASSLAIALASFVISLNMLRAIMS